MRLPQFLRSVTLLAAFFTLLAGRSMGESSAAATIQRLNDTLVTAMKQGHALGFEGRRRLLEPAVRDALDLPLMTRLVMGPPWRSLSGDQQQQLVAAFSNYSIATYANRFSDFSGEQFSVDPSPSPMPSGDVIVHSTLRTNDPEPVKLDYMMREHEGRWRVIDVYLNGTISELAARRSEYSAILRAGGAEALVGILNRKAEELAK